MNIFSKMTLRNLRVNRTRTIVTIIGILLSTAMFTAVTTSVTSFQQFLIDYTIYGNGAWHIKASSFTEEDLAALEEDSEVDQITVLKEYGFAKLDDYLNPNKPYLCIYGIPQDADNLLPIHMIDGRLPENDSELILPEHLEVNGGLSYELGDTIDLTVGARFSGDHYQLDNHDGYYLDNGEGEKETLENTVNTTYTVVGFYERPSFEDFDAPGYSALTALSESASVEKKGCYDVYFTVKNLKEAYNFFSTYDFPADCATSMNNSLLRTYGASGESAYNAVLYSMGSILIAIIVFGSIALIYNSFSISINERTKQLGILSSLGATKKQLLKSVTAEGFFMSIIGIPLGILSGLLGIGVTFYLLRDNFSHLTSAAEHVHLSLHPSAASIVIAAGLALFTIYLSALLPAKRALKHTAIEVIRESDEVKISPRKIKISKPMQKIFGFEGTLSLKNFKRNRRKYRSTVFSLFISIVLFISVSSFGAYLMESAEHVYEDFDYDVEFSLQPTDENTSLNADLLKKTFGTMEGISGNSYYVCLSLPLGLNPAGYTSDFFTNREATWNSLLTLDSPEEDLVYTQLVFVEDSVFETYLKEHGIDPASYFNPMAPKAVMTNQISSYSSDDQRYHVYTMIDNLEAADPTLYAIYAYNDMDNCTWYQEADGSTIAEYYNYDDDSTVKFPLKQAAASIEINCDTILEEGPPMTYQTTNCIVFYYPYSQMDALFLDAAGNDFCSLPTYPLSENAGIDFTFQCENHAEVAASLNEWLKEHPGWSGYVNDYAEATEDDVAMITIVNVFCYGFIVLISLIAATNVFNTISTNIRLRRREFAMLRSVGMTPKGFQKMMNLECFFYGIKSLLYGLPAAVIVTYFIYRAVSNGMEMAFFLPWYSIVIAVFSVFAVVFSTMVYTMSKIKKENTIDALKDESF